MKAFIFAILRFYAPYLAGFVFLGALSVVVAIAGLYILYKLDQFIGW